MIPCPSCTFQNPDDTLACSKCGAPMDQSSARELIGQVLLGHYLIEDVLGQGGMSVVYRARHRLTEQVVALKVLPPELAIHSTLKSRFLEEARALAKRYGCLPHSAGGGPSG